jgi:Calcineurin-like phosphoesterase
VTDGTARRRDLSVLRRLPRSVILNYVRQSLDAAASTAGQRAGAASVPARGLLASHCLAWAAHYARQRLGPRHAFPDYTHRAGDTGVYRLAGDGAGVRVALAGDWASGTDEAAAVAAVIAAAAPHFTIHLGDIYYVGDEAEVCANFLGGPAAHHQPAPWPRGRRGTFALNGNHEMYARGRAYFDVLLPQLGLSAGPAQHASFFCLENRYWRIIALDTAYNSVAWPLLEELPWRPFAPANSLTGAQLRWLRDSVRPGEDRRGLIILTHHPPCSRFERAYPGPARQLARLIHRPVLWFWGHEHRLAVYERFAGEHGFEVFGRCIGHGGMPVELHPLVRDESARLVFTDVRRYPNDERIEVGYNGYAELAFTDERLAIEYRDLSGAVVWREAWSAGTGDLRPDAAV